MNTKKKAGEEGEAVAAGYLKRKGYRIIATNFKAEGCEIDIVAKDKNTIVFVEVKLRKNNRYGPPEMAVSEAKQQNIARAAEVFIEQNAVKEEIRFDVISVIPAADGRSIFSIHHICDAFSP